MKKILLSAVAMMFIAGIGASPLAMAQTKEEIAKACKDKKPGEMVKVGGKEVKCPEKK